MPSLRCLISALTQAGGGGLLFRFASSVQSGCREGGALHTDIAVCGWLSPCSGHTGFAPFRGVCAFPSTLLQLPAALYGAGPALSAVPVFRSSTKARIRLRLRVVSYPASAVQAARGLRALSLVRSAFSLLGEQLRQPEACAPSPRCGAPFPSAASGSGSQKLGRPLPSAARLFPPWRAARAARGLRALSPVRRAFSLRGDKPRQPEARCTFPGCSTPFPYAASGSGSQRLAGTLPGCGAPFPSAAPARTAGRVSGNL